MTVRKDIVNSIQSKKYQSDALSGMKKIKI